MRRMRAPLQTERRRTRARTPAAVSLCEPRRRRAPRRLGIRTRCGYLLFTTFV
jgi:hypothetical protein